MNKEIIKELKQLAEKFKDREANPAGLPAGTTALRADVAYLWVSKFIRFVEGLKDDQIDESGLLRKEVIND